MLLVILKIEWFIFLVSAQSMTKIRFRSRVTDRKFTIISNGFDYEITRQ